MSDPVSRTLVATLLVMAGCGSEGILVTGTSPSADRSPPGATEQAPASVGELATSRIEGVVVDLAERWDGGHRFWWVVDLTGGVTIDGASRVLVNVPQGEVGCGEDQRSILSFQISVGDRVSFQLDESGIVTPPGELRIGTDASSAVVVTARQVRIECPPRDRPRRRDPRRSASPVVGRGNHLPISQRSTPSSTNSNAAN